MERIENIIKDAAFQDYMLRIAAKEAKRKFCKHTFQHLIDVARITYILMMENKELKNFALKHNLANRERAKVIIYAAALLHDIARWVEYDTGEDHALKGAELAVDILNRAGFAKPEIYIVTQAIREHRGFTENMSLLGEYLHRADNLSRGCYFCEAKSECHKIDNMETGIKALIY